MNSKYGLEQEYSLPQEYYNSDFINYPNIKVELKYNPTYYEGSLCILPSKKVSLPRYIGGSTTQPIYKYLKQYCKVTGKMDEYNEFVQSPFLEESIVKDVSEYVPHIPSEVSGANVADSTSSQTQIKQSKAAAQPQSPPSSVSEPPLGRTTHHHQSLIHHWGRTTHHHQSLSHHWGRTTHHHQYSQHQQ